MMYMTANRTPDNSIGLTTNPTQALVVTIPVVACAPTSQTTVLIDISTSKLKKNSGTVGHPYVGACRYDGESDLSPSTFASVRATGVNLSPSNSSDVDSCLGQSHIWSKNCLTGALSMNWVSLTGVVAAQAFLRSVTYSAGVIGPHSQVRLLVLVLPWRWSCSYAVFAMSSTSHLQETLPHTL